MAVAGLGLVALGRDPFAAIEASVAQRNNGLGLLAFVAGMYGLAWLGLRRLAARAPVGAVPSAGGPA